jgi:hypothetical protein
MQLRHVILLGVWFAMASVLPYHLGCSASRPNPLVGKWTLDRGDVDRRIPYRVQWEFDSSYIIVRSVYPSGQTNEVSRSRYRLNMSKTPAWITVWLDGEVRNGLFSIVGDELHLKQTIGGGARPDLLSPTNCSLFKRVAQPLRAANGD